MPPYAQPVPSSAPLVRAPQYGLYSAAQVVDLDATDRVGLGVIYVPESCGPSGFAWQTSCAGDSVEKVLGDEPGFVQSEGFWVINGLNCFPEGDPAAKARARFAAREQRIVEHTLWTGADGVLTSPFASATTPILGGGLVGLVEGVGLLEKYLADNYDGMGIIHAPVVVASFAAERSQVERSGTQLMTTLGTSWAFGRGYSENLGPDGDPAAAGSAWMYVTGQVVVRRGPVREPRFEDALDRTDNQLRLIVERPVSATVDCVIAAVRVELTDCCA